MWFFTILFPILLGFPVPVEIGTVSQVHCERVRAMIVSQLDAHHSNAVVSVCKPKEEEKR